LPARRSATARPYRYIAAAVDRTYACIRWNRSSKSGLDVETLQRLFVHRFAFHIPDLFALPFFNSFEKPNEYYIRRAGLSGLFVPSKSAFIHPVMNCRKEKVREDAPIYISASSLSSLSERVLFLVSLNRNLVRQRKCTE
jgi:hypothetical protein